jgi:hypothetical protein
MEAVSGVFFGLLVAVAMCAADSAPAKPTLVEFWHVGDGALSQKVADSVETALKQSPDFILSSGRLRVTWPVLRSIRIVPSQASFANKSSVSERGNNLPLTRFARVGIRSQPTAHSLSTVSGNTRPRVDESNFCHASNRLDR